MLSLMNGELEEEKFKPTPNYPCDDPSFRRRPPPLSEQWRFVAAVKFFREMFVERKAISVFLLEVIPTGIGHRN